MPVVVWPPSHPQLFVVIAVVAVVTFLVSRVPVIGRLISLVVTVAFLGLLAFVLSQRAEFDPMTARIAHFLKLDDQQQIVGKEMRVPMARDGHFWVRVRIGGIERRMLVDSGATITALSADTAHAAGLSTDDSLIPMLIRTANGTVPAQTSKVRELRIGNIVARDLPVVVSPAFGDINVIGMNFLSRLKSWRVEDGALMLTPHHPQEAAAEKG